ncbi:hypothetical protein BJ138DRAFT_1131374 [Hygrophoropsis aurantiaca]|uniref:Uncharacterized protein n=1 Tax=Hygrophoropsis aurantiaca TaxID=72124 RepID=A0ACB7ZRX5_9AGAM|nr:hypothetical protein BJ138DRAFT_1131374 [Hygrophoropsis aurantiaca]
MVNKQIPLVDEENPFYCPDISASSYLATLRHSLHSNASRFQDSSLRTFLWKLGSGCLKKDMSPAWNAQNAQLNEPSQTTSSPLVASPWMQGRGIIPKDPRFDKDDILKLHHAGPYRALKRNFDLSDSSSTDYMRGPTKRRKSSMSVYVSSMDLDSDRNGPIFSVVRSRGEQYGPAAYDVTDKDFILKYGPNVEDETPSHLADLIIRLSLLLPGVGIQRSILDNVHLFQLSHQKIATILANRGLLTEGVLTAIRGTKVEYLDLGPSLSDENGLNLHHATVLRGFRRPGTFTSLTELSFSDARICDSDLAHIQHLPAIRKLKLECTGVGNEAIFLLASLKNTLTFLDLALNPNIDNDAIPVIMLFSKLSYLSLFGTSIDMSGLRRLAALIHEEHRILDIEIPSECEEYLDDLHYRCLLDIEAPLTTEPSAVPLLSDIALMRNLAAHAAVNHSISASGTRTEMTEKLTNILTTRKADLIVRAMFYGDDEDLNEEG